MEQPICQYCGKPIKGRSDKRFCNDDCRNHYNRHERQEKTKPHPNTQEIFRIIRKNYILLKALAKPDALSTNYYDETITELGINQNFCTSAHLDADGKLWRYCFDYGWYNYSAARGCQIRYRPDKAFV